MLAPIFTFVFIALVVTLLVVGAGYFAWVLAGATALQYWWVAGGAEPSWLFGTCLGLWIGLTALFGYRPLRRQHVTARLMPLLAPIMPRISDTERVALEAGTVWWDGELFSGQPDWRRLIDFQVRDLTPREQAFLNGPVETLCAMIDDWAVVQNGDLPAEVWDYMKRERFLGMIIPESYGGLGFSAQAHSAVVTKLSSRSVTAAVTTMVPNSLGPAELLLHYGTEEQRNHWLPRLASGEEIPCFALTGPENGSDAAAMEAVGVVCRGQWQGQEIVGLRLDWDKRYTTLGPIATVIGMAFKLRDPDRLLGADKVDYGITCALVPADLPGIRIGERHDPLGVPFLNGPSWGSSVFVPLDAIIGGADNAGQGWRMLMDCLAAGRAISLPSLSAGCTQTCTRLAGAYASVRKQFNLPIGRFEGVQEALTRIGGLNYMLNAARRLTAGAVDAGEKPSVLSAVMKAYSTEAMRDVVNDTMDVLGGAGISRGPRNSLARAYQAVPIGITVEGANILTRTMIIFGQGAIRCHPFVQEEMRSVEDEDLVRFDESFFGHVNFVVCNVARAFFRGVVNPPVTGVGGSWEVRRQMARISRCSAAFSVLADVAMATLGGNLKRSERLTGRFADALAWMYMASAAIKRYVDEGQVDHDRPYMRWAVDHSVAQVRTALSGVLDNLPLRPAAWLLRPILFPFGARAVPPSDRIATKLARGIIEDGEQRVRHTPEVYQPPADEPGLGFLEATLGRAREAAPAERKLRAAVSAGTLERRLRGEAQLRRALELQVLTESEANLVCQARRAQIEAVQVDSFGGPEFVGLRG